MWFCDSWASVAGPTYSNLFYITRSPANFQRLTGLALENQAVELYLKDVETNLFG